MTTTELARGPRWRGFALPLAIGVILVGAVLAVVVLAATTSGPGGPGTQVPFKPPPEPVYRAYDVQSRDGANLLLTADGDAGPPHAVVLGSNTKIERLEPTAVVDIKPGDWVIVDGVPNEVNNFAARRTVVLAGVRDPAAALVASPGGFYGFETVRTRDDRAILSGRVQRLEGQAVVLDSAGGPVHIDFGEGPQLFRLSEGTLADIHPGDRLALIGGESAPTAALVQAPLK